jgi:hypothetical protein
MEEPLELEPPDLPPIEEVYMDTQEDNELTKLSTLPTIELPPKKTTRTTKPLSSGGGGGYFPQIKTQKAQKKKIPPLTQPKMKVGGLDKLREYNQEFK